MTPRYWRSENANQDHLWYTRSHNQQSCLAILELGVLFFKDADTLAFIDTPASNSLQPSHRRQLDGYRTCLVIWVFHFSFRRFILRMENGPGGPMEQTVSRNLPPAHNL